MGIFVLSYISKYVTSLHFWKVDCITSIKLFSHNQSAFESALDMLDSVGKAAVVHPTGTGKSYIGFKLCETFPPIIYKQQIGRALSASKKNVPIIFDIVNNIENLYSISSIQEEMKVAISYYRFLGQKSYIVNDQFTVIDEVREAKELFDKLDDTLTASWDTMYGYAKQYYEQNGDLMVPAAYVDDDGVSLR